MENIFIKSDLEKMLHQVWDEPRTPRRYMLLLVIIKFLRHLNSGHKYIVTMGDERFKMYCNMIGDKQKGVK